MPARPPIWLYAAPLPAMLAGVGIAGAHGISPVTFVPNAVALVLGIALLAFSVHKRARAAKGPDVTPNVRPDITPRVAAPLALLLLGLTVLSPDLDGVHRWLSAGPVWLHASQAVVPWALAALAAPAPNPRTHAVGLAAVLAIQAVHLAQPDAAQASALALGALPLLPFCATGRTGRTGRRALNLATLLALIGLAAATWARPDPLAPVDHVERIFALAADLGPLAVLAATLGTVLLFAPAARAFIAPDPHAKRLGAAFALYLDAQFVAPFIGQFPVPVVGASAAPVLGWFALVAVLATRAPRAPSAP